MCMTCPECAKLGLSRKGRAPLLTGQQAAGVGLVTFGFQPWTPGFALMALSSNQICLPFGFLSYFAALLILTASFFCFLVSFFWNKKTQYLIKKRFVFILPVALCFYLLCHIQKSFVSHFHDCDSEIVLHLVLNLIMARPPFCTPNSVDGNLVIYSFSANYGA